MAVGLTNLFRRWLRRGDLTLPQKGKRWAGGNAFFGFPAAEATKDQVDAASRLGRSARPKAAAEVFASGLRCRLAMPHANGRLRLRPPRPACVRLQAWWTCRGVLLPKTAATARLSIVSLWCVPVPCRLIQLDVSGRKNNT